MTLRAAAASCLLALLLGTAGCSGTQPNNAKDTFPEEISDFTELFNRNCSGCHGANGMKGPAPRLNDPLYLAVADRDAIYNVIKNGRPGTPMPALGKEQGGPLTEKQIGILADGMQRNWSRKVNTNGVAVPIYSVDKAPPGDAQRGRTAYQRNCMACHGFGAFKGAAGPVAEPSYLAIASNQGLRTTMIVGRPDWGMPDWAHRIPKHPMTDEEMSDVTAWLASQRPKYSPLATPNGTPEPHPPAPGVSTSFSGQQSKQEK